jgi:hypothetical protein
MAAVAAHQHCIQGTDVITVAGFSTVLAQKVVDFSGHVMHGHCEL